MKKVADFPKVKRCKHPEHNPPRHIVLSPGIYEHKCPACGVVQTIRVENVQWVEIK